MLGSSLGDSRTTTPRVDWPLVGRSDDLDALWDLLGGAEPRSVVLVGPPGAGRTRLGHECLERARRAGMATARVVGTRAAAAIPFGAFAALVEPPPATPAGVDDRLEVLRRSVAALSERPDGQQFVLFVDDAHLLDDESAMLVHQAVVSGGVTVLAVVPVDEPAPDPVAGLWKDGLAARYDIGSLAPAVVEELLGAVLDGPVDPAAARRFAELSQGDVVFLRELVVGALDDGSLQDDGGIWRLVGPLAFSSGLVEIVESRLGRLDDAERELLELVTFGEPLGHEELAALSDPALAEALERRGLLTSELDGRHLEIRLAHPIYGEVVRARTPAVRARAVAESLAATARGARPERDDDVLRVATWHLTVGGGAAELLMEGAAIARRRGDAELAERLARAAAAAGAGADASLLAAALAGRQGRRDDAEAELTALAEQAARGGDDRQRSKVAAARFDNDLVTAGRGRVRVIDEAVRTIADPEARHRLEARRLMALLDDRGPRAAAEAARALVPLARGEALAYACVVGAHSVARLGRIEEALALSDRGDEAYAAAGAPLGTDLWWHARTRGAALLHAGRFAEADEIVADHHERAVAEGWAAAQAEFAALAVVAVGDRGETEAAARRAREALAIHRDLGDVAGARRAHAIAALAAALEGRADDAAAELVALDDLGLPPLLRDEVDVVVVRAWAAAAAGDLPGAGEHFIRAADLGERIGDAVGEANALHGLARIGRAGEVAERLADVCAGIDGDLARLRAAHAEVLARGDAPGLTKVSHELESIGAHLLAAEVAADAAVVMCRQGEARDAAAAERRAGLLAERCGGPVTPALHATAPRAYLTPSERETANLAAAGRSNKEIAAQLVLSTRTVENRLQRVYEKLGISGRAELADELAVDA